MTYREPIVQNPRREIAIGIGTGSRESDTSWLGKDFPLSSEADNWGRNRVAVLRLFQDFTQREERDVWAARSQFCQGVAAFGATVSSSSPDSQFLVLPSQLHYLRLLAPETLLRVRSDVELAGAELLGLEPFGIGGSDTLRGYRQDAMLADSGIFDSAELRYPMQAHPRQARSFARDAVCGFWQSLESQGKGGFGSEYFAIRGIAVAVTVRRKVECSRRLGNSFD
ncbi:ShlB/FhaC/HecB family hemolysin secretion/activation protein [Microcoleus sp. K1-B6]|uniref:ShlB/FhaC/HecB family hemolysin secretion/activation protein n=1 Tax=unclassified Microcoleus TaxID=2642155 RepID=UPI002FD2DE4D